MGEAGEGLTFDFDVNRSGLLEEVSDGVEMTLRACLPES